MKIITLEILKSWQPCSDGYKKFVEILPNGGTLKECADALSADGRDDWAIWLFDRCRRDDGFKDQAVGGHQNTGDQNTGHRNTGHQNIGDQNTGDQNIGHQNTGDRNTGHRNTGDQNTGHRNTGDQNTGDQNIGDQNIGHQNTGDQNTGDQNIGHQNTGDRNTGHRNTGDQNTGDQNTGDQNTGDRNTGDQNIGDRNTGDQNIGDQNVGHRNIGGWNTGHRNTGFFNTGIPDEVLCFNKPCKRETWNDCNKPNFIYFNINFWVYESEMTDQEKIDNKYFYVAGGYLKYIEPKEAWRKSWDATSDEDKRLVLTLPNFDADVFLEVSGIDVRKELV